MAICFIINNLEKDVWTNSIEINSLLGTEQIRGT